MACIIAAPVRNGQGAFVWHYAPHMCMRSFPVKDSAVKTVRRIAMVGFDGIQVMDVTGPLEVFSRAGRLLVERGEADAPPYEVVLAARHAGPIKASSGLALVASATLAELGEVDTLLVSGGAGTRAALQDNALLEWLATHAPRARRYGSVFTGALLLGRAGLLDGKRVTTHWAFLQELAALAPGARIEPDAIFVRDDRLWTSAGVTAGMDMALAMVEQDWGRKLALDVAHHLVMYLQRHGGHSQLSAMLAAQSSSAEGQFRSLVRWIQDNVAEDLSIECLAQRSEMSVRNFSRRFREETGLTPAKFVEQRRFEAARLMLAEGGLALEDIAPLCGFGSAETLRRVFIRRTGLSPAAYRLRLQREQAPVTAAAVPRGL
jgi:transcriptional regulator GlxA family with amidase domain